MCGYKACCFASRTSKRWRFSPRRVSPGRDRRSLPGDIKIPSLSAPYDATPRSQTSDSVELSLHTTMRPTLSAHPCGTAARYRWVTLIELCRSCAQTTSSVAPWSRSACAVVRRRL